MVLGITPNTKFVYSLKYYKCLSKISRLTKEYELR